jgi:aspartyl-tRNA synthetase
MSLPEAPFGELPLIQSQSRGDRQILSVSAITPTLINQEIFVRAHASVVRGKGKCGFLLLRSGIQTVQACVFAGKEIPVELAKFVQQIPVESLVEVFGKLTETQKPVTSATLQNVEIQIQRCYIVSRAQPTPIVVADCARATEEDDESTAPPDDKRPRVSQSSRLDNRVLDLRTIANNAIFRVQSRVCQFFRDFLLARDFQEIHTPKLIATASEGGSSVFEVKYFDRTAYLAQSPQFYKQMAVVAGMPRVFEIGPVFRAELSYTHRHLTEFTGLDCEMAFDTHYHEALELFRDLLVDLFRRLQTECAAEIAAVRSQFPSTDLVVNPVIIAYPEAVALLREDGKTMDDFDDLSTELERRLGELVKTKYNTDFFILDKFPSAVRPVYSMPDPVDPRYANAYDMFLRGEEIVSGAQRVHDADLLLRRAVEKNIDLKPVQAYVDCFKYGAPPHAGLGCGLDRITFLFLGLKNVRRGSLFPRDPGRITP